MPQPITVHAPITGSTRPVVLGRILRTLRENQCLTQATVAARIHVSQQRISELERGRGGFDWFLVLDYADAVGCDDIRTLRV